MALKTPKPDEIVALLEELKNTQATQTRMSGYNDIVSELGREYNESERFAYMKPKTSRKKHSWEVSDDPTDFLVHVPFLPQIIEAQRTVLGAMRSHRVPLPSPDGQAYSDKLERGIAHMWREWGMPRFASRRDSFSDFSTEIVPTRIGRPTPCTVAISSTAAP